MSYAAAIALGRAIGYISGLSLAEVAGHNRELASQLADGLAQRGARLLTPRDPGRRAGTVTARFPGHDGEAIAAALTERGVIVSPCVGSTVSQCTSTTASTTSSTPGDPGRAPR